MSIFLDTSGFLAVLDSDDTHHVRASEAWKDMLSSDEILVTTNYVLVETLALAQHRLGLEATRLFHEAIVPVIQIRWIDNVIHHAAIAILFTASRRKLSFVDCVSFEIMRIEGIGSAFTMDTHFREQGFSCIPS